MAMITDINDCFDKGCGRCDRFDTADCATRVWADGLLLLRDLCRAVGLNETVKWGHPCYVHAGRNVAIIGAFRQDFRLSLFEAGLMRDPDQVLVRQGPNTTHADALKFTSADDVRTRSATIAEYLQEAKCYAAEGRKAAKPARDLTLPAELSDALDGDPELAEAFHALTPGRQRSYVINLSGAKRSETRIARIAKFRDRILAGKGAQER